MRWISVVSEKEDPIAALEECAQKIRAENKEIPDIAFLFPSFHHAKSFDKLAPALKKLLSPRNMIGCSARAVIAGGSEVEHKPAMGITCAWMPQVSFYPFQLEQEGMPGPDEPPSAWRKWIGFEDTVKKPVFVILSDPFTLDPEAFLRGMDYAFPTSVKVGGLASAADRPGKNAFYLNGETFIEGAVGMAMSGNIAVDSIVAQGCRPIGKPFRITECSENVLIAVDGKNVLETLGQMLESVPAEDKRLARNALFLGILNDPTKQEISQKDYLIRNIVGVDSDKGSLAIGSWLRQGQIIQFHVRDSKASAQDLGEILEDYAGRLHGPAPCGALLFSCVGRGVHLYKTPNHDSDLFRNKVGQLPIGGFFCNGEFGPVDGSTYIHGFTSCFGIFRPAHP